MIDDMQNDITTQITSALKAEGYRVSEVAQRLGVSTAQTSRILSGKCRPSVDQLEVLARMAGVDIAVTARRAEDRSPVLKLVDAAQIVKRHPQTLRKAIRAGELRAVQQCRAGHWLIRESDLLFWAGVRR